MPSMIRDVIIGGVVSVDKSKGNVAMRFHDADIQVGQCTGLIVITGDSSLNGIKVTPGTYEIIDGLPVKCDE